jgi:two-component system cell cycle response regulator
MTAHPPAASQPPAPAHAAIDVRDCRVLLVDDHEQNLELLLAYLEELGCELRTATDGPEALEDVAKHPPDLILLDIMMPKMSGFQVCKKLRADATTASIPVLMVTALNEVADVERAVEVGANDFISKPVQRVELLTRTRSLLQLAKLQKQLKQTVGQVRKLQG